MKNVELLQDFLTREAIKTDWAVKEIQLSPAFREHPDLHSNVTDNLETRAFVAGLHPIILAELGVDLKRAPADWAAAQRLAAIARTSVAADSGEDLVLILVGQSGTRDSQEWQAFAMEVERNDLVCRKLVWLPPQDATDNNASLREFLRRTFLAKPWVATENIPQTALDALSEKNAVLMGWEEILDQQPLNRADVDYDALVEKLINACHT